MSEIDLETLKEAGLTGYEAKSYIELLRYGTMQGSKVAEKSDVPKTRVYDALKSLSDKGLASKIQERPMKFSPVEPEKGLKPLYERKKNRIEHFEKEAMESLNNIEPIGEQSAVQRNVDVFLGQRNMFSQVFERIEDARDEITALIIGRVPSKKYKIRLRELAERGVKIRLMITQYDSEIKEEYESLTEIASIRYYDSKPDYAILVKDKETAMINVLDPEKDDDRISIFFEAEGLSEALSSYLNNIWAEAVPLDQITKQHGSK
jgi:sugar-specific transcriptional regulator TrmB